MKKAIGKASAIHGQAFVSYEGRKGKPHSFVWALMHAAEPSLSACLMP